MSQENVEAFKRGVNAMNHGDIDGMLDVIDPDVAWRDAINVMFGGEATMYRGHDAVRELFRDLYGSFAEIDADYSDVRDLGDERVLGLGHLRMRGKESGAETESPVAALTSWSNGKAVRVLTYLDHTDALEAAGLSEQAPAHFSFHRRVSSRLVSTLWQGLHVDIRFVDHFEHLLVSGPGNKLAPRRNYRRAERPRTHAP